MTDDVKGSDFNCVTRTLMLIQGKSCSLLIYFALEAKVLTADISDRTNFTLLVK